MSRRFSFEEIKKRPGTYRWFSTRPADQHSQKKYLVIVDKSGKATWSSKNDFSGHSCSASGSEHSYEPLNARPLLLLLVKR